MLATWCRAGPCVARDLAAAGDLDAQLVRLSSAAAASYLGALLGLELLLLATWEPCNSQRNGNASVGAPEMPEGWSLSTAPLALVPRVTRSLARSLAGSLTHSLAHSLTSAIVETLVLSQDVPILNPRCLEAHGA